MDPWVAQRQRQLQDEIAAADPHGEQTTQFARVLSIKPAAKEERFREAIPDGFSVQKSKCQVSFGSVCMRCDGVEVDAPCLFPYVLYSSQLPNPSMTSFTHSFYLHLLIFRRLSCFQLIHTHSPTRLIRSSFLFSDSYLFALWKLTTYPCIMNYDSSIRYINGIELVPDCRDHQEAERESCQGCKEEGGQGSGGCPPGEEEAGAHAPGQGREDEGVLPFSVAQVRAGRVKMGCAQELERVVFDCERRYVCPGQ
ncbi:MAG: hypothetical protein JOS17DRAFT_764708 [Linnemannia elongata]|nr:MAG: hypothetical protein JOS17DRAFT_764708 [Linnemannia elongata]